MIPGRRQVWHRLQNTDCIIQMMSYLYSKLAFSSRAKSVTSPGCSPSSIFERKHSEMRPNSKTETQNDKSETRPNSIDASAFRVKGEGCLLIPLKHNTSQNSLNNTDAVSVPFHEDQFQQTPPSNSTSTTTLLLRRSLSSPSPAPRLASSPT